MKMLNTKISKYFQDYVNSRSLTSTETKEIFLKVEYIMRCNEKVKKVCL